MKFLQFLQGFGVSNEAIIKQLKLLKTLKQKQSIFFTFEHLNQHSKLS